MCQSDFAGGNDDCVRVCEQHHLMTAILALSSSLQWSGRPTNNAYPIPPLDLISNVAVVL